MPPEPLKLLFGLLQLGGVALLMGALYLGLKKWTIGAEAVRNGEVAAPTSHIFGHPARDAAAAGFRSRLQQGDPGARKVLRLQRYLALATLLLMAAVAVVAVAVGRA